jgi:4-amino-4-deoxy-L-arabinose transferase-like glycosyltransferase
VTERRSLPVWPALVIAFIALAAGVVKLQLLDTWNPVFDEVEYLSYGRTLAVTGQYAATPAGPKADPGPGREPLYPALIAAVMQIDPVLADNAGRCIGNDRDSTCPPIYRSLRWANALLMALVAAFTYLTARELGFGIAAGWTAGLYCALNIEILEFERYAISDFLSMAFAAALTWAVAMALVRRHSLRHWIAVGLLAGLLILTKGIYEFYAALGIAALALAAILRRDRKTVIALAAATLSVGIVVGSWVARNDVVFGRPVLTDARGAIALSTREELNHMNARQYLTAFVWWIRGPLWTQRHLGAEIGAKLLPERDWHRFDTYAPDGFYMMGQVTNYAKRVERLMDERGLSQAAAEGAVSGVIVREFFNEFPDYVATTLPVFYRGLWFDTFILFGFPALVWCVIRSVRRRDWTCLATFSPGIFSLFAYAMLSLNIPRYQFTALPPIALSAGMAVAVLWARFRGRA